MQFTKLMNYLFPSALLPSPICFFFRNILFSNLRNAVIVTHESEQSITITVHVEALHSIETHL